jgi:hypothetical protein
LPPVTFNQQGQRPGVPGFVPIEQILIAIFHASYPSRCRFRPYNGEGGGIILWNLQVDLTPDAAIIARFFAVSKQQQQG